MHQHSTNYRQIKDFIEFKHLDETYLGQVINYPFIDESPGVFQKFPMPQRLDFWGMYKAWAVDRYTHKIYKPLMTKARIWVH